MPAALPVAHLEYIARVLGECGTGRDVERALAEAGVADDGTESTKWKRLARALAQDQVRRGRGDGVIAVIEALMAPYRFAERPDTHARLGRALNAQLAFAGLHCGPDGRVRPVV
jgi:hypothetical protein